MESGGAPLWRSLAGLAALGFGAVVAFFLLTEHRAHLYGALPLLLLLAWPVMMMFMHHGHAGHPDKAHSDSATPDSRREQRP